MGRRLNAQHQDISDAIGRAVLQQIIKNGRIENVATLVSDDVSIALNSFAQTIGGWGGSFYYWNLTYTDATSGLVVSVGDAISNSNNEYEKFITVNALATVAALNQQGDNLESLSIGAKISHVFDYLGSNIFTAFTASAPLDVKEQIIGRVLDDRAGYNPAGDPNIVDGYFKTELPFAGTSWIKLDGALIVFADPVLATKLEARSQIISQELARFSGTSPHTEILPNQNGGYVVLQASDGPSSSSSIIDSYDPNDKKISTFGISSDATFSGRLYRVGSSAELGLVTGSFIEGTALEITNLSNANSPITISPIGGIIQSAKANADNSVEINLSLSIGGLPVSVMANADGSYRMGLDPPIFQPVVEFSKGGLDGSIEEVSVSQGTAIYNSRIGDGKTVEVGASFVVPSTEVRYTFTSGQGILKLDDPWSFNGIVYGSITGDFVEFAGVTSAQITQFATRTDPTFKFKDLNSEKVATVRFAPNEDYSNASFGVGNLLGNGDLAIEVFRSVACFLPGTRILTENGEVKIEELEIGDHVITASGTLRTIKWIGHRSYDGRFVENNHRILPIRISAEALADGIPSHDLWISPEHALYIDSVLVAAQLLVNGSTVVQTNRIDLLEYFHIELEDHDILIANDTPVESYVECDNRDMFQNAREFAKLYPNDDRQFAGFYAPRLQEDALELNTIRELLTARVPVAHNNYLRRA